MRQTLPFNMVRAREEEKKVRKCPGPLPPKMPFHPLNGKVAGIQKRSTYQVTPELVAQLRKVDPQLRRMRHFKRDIADFCVYRILYNSVTFTKASYWDELELVMGIFGAFWSIHWPSLLSSTSTLSLSNLGEPHRSSPAPLLRYKANPKQLPQVELRSNGADSDASATHLAARKTGAYKCLVVLLRESEPDWMNHPDQSVLRRAFAEFFCAFFPDIVSQ